MTDEIVLVGKTPAGTEVNWYLSAIDPHPVVEILTADHERVAVLPQEVGPLVALLQIASLIELKAKVF